MRLYLAVAMLLLALVAYTEAQEETVEDKLTKFGQQLGEMGKNLAEQVKTSFQDINTSEFAEKTRNWFAERLEQIKSLGDKS
ncbi:apolipoprotein C-I [Menidia menidia]